MKRTCSIVCLIIILTALVGLIGCSGDTETSRATEDAVQPGASDKPQLVTVRDTIEYNLNHAMNRLRLNDKSGLYDNEFEYFRAETSFDDYLKLRNIAAAKVDSLSSLDVTDVTMFGHDSADVKLIVHFIGSTGKHTEFPDGFMVYYNDGNWIKPTVSTIDKQIEWEKSGSK